VVSLSFTLETIYPSGNFKGKKHIFKPLCRNVNENCDVDVAIDPASYQSASPAIKLQGKTTLQIFSFFSFFLYFG